MKEVVGLNKNDRWYVTKNILRVLWLIWTKRKALDYIEANTCLLQAHKVTTMGIAPSTEMVRSVVDKMPFEPFGAPGITDTTKFDGNLAQQYVQDKD
jgi:hypothetical protein